MSDQQQTSTAGTPEGVTEESQAPRPQAEGGTDPSPQANWWPSWGQQGEQPGAHAGASEDPASGSAPGASPGYGAAPYGPGTYPQGTPDHAAYQQQYAGNYGQAYSSTGWQPPASDQAPASVGATHDSWRHDTAVYPNSAPVQPTPPPAKRDGGRVGLLLAAAAIAGLLAGGVGGFVGAQLADTDTTASSTEAPVAELPQAAPDTSPRAEGSVADIAARVSPAVVSIGVQSSEGAGTGSGFIIREDGYILTNNHVVAEAAEGGEITVRMSGGQSYPATIVGRDSAYDLAVIKIDGKDLPAVTLGDSDSVVVGDLAIAIGSPLGLDGTVTAGIISALNRPVTAGTQNDTSFINAIQTDAAINPGNSGGALLNGDGHVIGVNSAIATLGDSSGQSGSIGLGFAIPINEAKRIADELIATGTSTKPVIGVRLDVAYEGEGARVTEVTPGGAAEEAGMKAGDIITEFNGRAVTNSTELIVAIRAMNPGDKVEVVVKRGNDTETLTVTLGSDTSSN